MRRNFQRVITASLSMPRIKLPFPLPRIKRPTEGMKRKGGA